MTNIFDLLNIYNLNIYLNEIYFCLNYDLIYIYDFRQSDYVLTLIPSQWGLFIDTLIPSQWGLFIGTETSSRALRVYRVSGPS